MELALITFAGIGIAAVHASFELGVAAYYTDLLKGLNPSFPLFK